VVVTDATAFDDEEDERFGGRRGDELCEERVGHRGATNCTINT
jgi:hypothetical protein